MSALAFDTLKFVEKLESGGFSREQAKAAAQAFADATGEQLATKTDLQQLSLQLDTKFESTKTDILRWMFVSQLPLGGFMFAAVRLIH
jgi:hypothetical protein